VGFDISNHPVDVALIKQRIVPFVCGGDDRLDDLIARAARLNCIKYRANSWGLALLDYSWAISDRQRALGITRTVRVRRPPKGIIARLLGRPPTVEDVTYPQVTGIPGFDGDLSVWGRPFFIVADTTDDALEGLDTYLALPDAAPQTVDAVAQRMLAKLDARRDLPPPGFDPSVLRVLFDSYPLTGRLVPQQEGQPPDEGETARQLRRRFDLARTVFADRSSDAVVEADDGDAIPAAEWHLR
jgi:hypothetical protein